MLTRESVKQNVFKASGNILQKRWDLSPTSDDFLTKSSFP